MKKALAYVAIALLLGFAVMMLPRTLETQVTMNAPQTGDFAKTLGVRSEDSSKAAVQALASQPSNLVPSSLIILSGLIVALVAYVILRKRTI